MNTYNIFSIEGNIGSGKTSLVKFLKENLLLDNFAILEEPVEEWFKIKNTHEQNLFELFYNDPEKYAYLFQNYVCYTRISKLKQCTSKNIICERSIITDYNVFIKCLYEDGKISELEFKVFKSWFDMILEMSKFVLRGIIYINTSPYKCFTRIQLRNRNGEQTIPIDYLQHLDKKHSEWLSKPHYESITYTINGDIDIINLHSDKLIDSIRKFIEKLSEPTTS